MRGNKKGEGNETLDKKLDVGLLHVLGKPDENFLWRVSVVLKRA